MGEIVISIDSQAIERAIYWVIIIVLAGLLAWSYFGNSNCDSGTNVTAAVTQDTTSGAENAAPVTEPSTETAPEDNTPEESCFDSIKNQYETDVDCGGDCDAGCDEGDACFRDSDCDTGLTCESNKCEGTPDLSGTIDFVLNSVTKLKSPTTDTYKIDAVKVTITNGKSSKLIDPYVKVFVKSMSGILLNQAGADDFEDLPYFIYSDIPSINSGETKTITIDIGGSYIWAQTGYSDGDDFKVNVELYDSDDEKLESATKTVTV